DSAGLVDAAAAGCWNRTWRPGPGGQTPQASGRATPPDQDALPVRRKRKGAARPQLDGGCVPGLMQEGPLLPPHAQTGFAPENDRSVVGHPGEVRPVELLQRLVRPPRFPDLDGLVPFPPGQETPARPG